MNNKLSVLFFIVCCCLATFVSPKAQAQTLSFRVMQTNLLGYPASFTASDTRYNNFGNIAHYLGADLIMCEELKDNSLDARGADSLLIRGLNTNGITYYAHTDLFPSPTSEINNMLFYNTNKFGLAYHIQITAPIRNIDYYTLYIKDPNLAYSHDTTFLDVAIAHLKASNTSTDAATRASMAQALVDYTNTLPANRNIIVGGDFNLYSPTEAAYTILTSAPNLHTMVDEFGNNWSRDLSTNVGYYTQSTRGNSSPYLGGNGGASGGLDDRFDYILLNDNINSATNRINYVPNSNKVLGNDGLHYNKAVIEAPTHADIPQSIAQDIFDMSDHYPVYIDLQATLPVLTVSTPVLASNSITNVCSGGSADLVATATLNSSEQIEWYNNADLSGTPLAIGSSYTTPALTANQTYYAVVHNTATNTYGSVLSAQVWVSEPATPILAGSSTTTIVSGQTATLVATANLQINEQIEWYNNAALSGAALSTTGSYTTPSLTASQTYYAIVRNIVAGCTSSSALSATVTVTPPPCNTPTGITASGISTSGATITWAAVSGAVSYGVRYKPTTSTTWVSVTATAATITLSGLTASTSYEVQVATNCLGNASVYSASTSFTTATAAGCGTPNNTTASNITATSAKVQWAAVAGATSYTLQVRKSGVTAWTSYNTGAYTFRNLTGLGACKTYQWRVRSNCSSGTSSYSPIQSFSTICAQNMATQNNIDNTTPISAKNANDANNSQVLLLPNPANNQTTLLYNANGNEKTTINIFDVTGKMVSFFVTESVVGSNAVDLDISHLAKGCYVVAVKNGTNASQIKLIVL